MKRNKKKVKRGFTLVELIVVIAIIGVLAMMITPSIMGYVNKSKISRNEANAKTIAMSIQAINADLLVPLTAKSAETAGIITYTKNDGWQPDPDTTQGGTGEGSGVTFKSELDSMVKLDEGTAYVEVNEKGAVIGVCYAPKGATAANKVGIEAEPSEIIGNWQ